MESLSEINPKMQFQFWLNFWEKQENVSITKEQNISSYFRVKVSILVESREMKPEESYILQ